MTVALDALLLPAYDELDGLPSEVRPWQRHLSFTGEVQLPGVEHPLQHTDDGIGLLPTGVGKLAAATTVGALVGDDRVDLDDTTFISAGIAGGPPAEVAVGAVVVSSSIVDWDNKLRFDRPPLGATMPIDPNPYNRERAVIDLDESLVETAHRATEDLDIADHVRERAAGATAVVPYEPTEVHVGTNLCGDELFHGHRLAEQAEWLVETLDRAPYLVTEMEDMGTAAALERAGMLDRYLSVRGIANHDRPRDGYDGLPPVRELTAGATVAMTATARVVRELLAVVT